MPIRISVLSSLSSRKLEWSQDFNSDEHSVREEGGKEESGLQESYNWVSLTGCLDVFDFYLSGKGSPILFFIFSPVFVPGRKPKSCCVYLLIFDVEIRDQIFFSFFLCLEVNFHTQF